MREESVLSLVPRLEAFALPGLAERATTQKPHANMIYEDTAVFTYRVALRYSISTGIYRCFILD